MVTLWLTQVNNNQITKQTLVTHCDSLLTCLRCHIRGIADCNITISGKCWLPLWSEMDMRLLLRCAAPRRGSRGAGKGSWLCRIRRGSPSPRHRCPVCVNCTVYCVLYCAVLWRVAHHGNYHGEERDSGTSVRAGRGNIRDIVSVISHDTHNTRLLWELRRGNYWYGGFVYFWCMLQVY